MASYRSDTHLLLESDYSPTSVDGKTPEQDMWFAVKQEENKQYGNETDVRSDEITTAESAKMDQVPVKIEKGAEICDNISGPCDLESSPKTTKNTGAICPAAEGEPLLSSPGKRTKCSIS